MVVSYCRSQLQYTCTKNDTTRFTHLSLKPFTVLLSPHSRVSVFLGLPPSLLFSPSSPLRSSPWRRPSLYGSRLAASSVPLVSSAGEEKKEEKKEKKKEKKKQKEKKEKKKKGNREQGTGIHHWALGRSLECVQYVSVYCTVATR